MAKFSRSGKKDMPELSTSSLPDIVFMILFFFMVTTQYCLHDSLLLYGDNSVERD